MVRGFTFQGTGAEPSARLLPRDEARETYERIVAQARDPALLEFAGFNLVRSSVFPVEPGGTQAVRLTYEHMLTAERRPGRLRPAAERVGRVHRPLEDRGQDHVEHARSRRFTRRATGCGRRGRRRRSRPSSWKTTRRPSPARSGCRSSASAARSRRRCSRTPTPRSAAVTSCSSRACLRGRTSGAQRIKREVTLVIDRSGSMRGEKLVQVREAALQVLAGLDDGEAFNVILYNEAVEPFSERPVRKSRSTDASGRPSSSKG